MQAGSYHEDLRWVFCCGLVRAGSTLQYQLTASLLERTGIGKRTEWCPPDEFAEHRERYHRERGWLALKTHRLTAAMEEEFSDRGACGVLVYRDLRDAVASIIRKDGRSQVDVRRFVREQLRNYAAWASCPRVLTSRYEDMIVDLPAEVSRIAEHLDAPRDLSTIRAIARDHTLERQRRRIHEADPTELREVRGHRFDRKTLLHPDHIHFGQVGQWRHHLSSDDVETIEEEAGWWLREHGYDDGS